MQLRLGRLGAIELRRAPIGAALAEASGGEVAKAEQQLTPVPSTGRGPWGFIGRVLEPFAGAWQRNVEVDKTSDLLGFSAVFACVTLIAQDIAKLRIKLMDYSGDIGVEIESGSTAYLPVLRKPNRYQNRIKFVQQWIISKLIWGNTFALKQRDNRGVVVALYLLHPQRVTVLTTPDGGVYYQLNTDHLTGLDRAITVPASEIIHDMMPALFHPLNGISPLYACGQTATQGRRIQQNSTKFFDNMSRPSGVLIATGEIDDEQAKNLANEWNKNFSGGNIGKVAVLAGGLKYQPMATPARESQLIDQLQWTVVDVARCFHMPAFKVGGAIPPSNTVAQLNQIYYDDCLHALIEDFELCLDEGLELKRGYYTELDLDGLLRMDLGATITAEAEAVKAGIKAPDEARRRLNLGSVPGGKSPYLQQQNYSLAALAKRDALDDPFAPPTPPASEPTPKKPSGDDDDGDGGEPEEQSDEESAKETAALLEFHISTGRKAVTRPRFRKGLPVETA